MDVIKAVQNYVNKMIDEVPGMKVLLLDTETVGISTAMQSKTFTPTESNRVFYPLDTHSISCCNSVKSFGQRMLFD